MTGQRIDWRRHVWLHLLPFVPPVYFCLSFALKDEASVKAFYDVLQVRQPPEAMFLLSLATLQMTCYMLVSMRMIRRYNRRIGEIGYERIMGLRWLFVLTGVLLGFSLVGVPLLLLIVRSDISVLYVYMPVITMVIYLALFYRSISFSGTEFEKRLIREQERRKISRDMHDELGAGITRIALLSEIAKREGIPGPQQLDEISGNARQLADNLREIVSGLSSQYDSLDNLMSYLRAYAAGYLEDAGIEGRIVFPVQVPDLQLSHELRRHITLAVKEALHNIVRHAAARHVELTAVLSASALSLHIADDGAGFDPLCAGPGNGLKNMEARIAQAGGSFLVDARPGRGTRITISGIPLR